MLLFYSKKMRLHLNIRKPRFVREKITRITMKPFLSENSLTEILGFAFCTKYFAHHFPIYYQKSIKTI